MPKVYGLGVGIMMLVVAVYSLAWMPTLKKRLAKREQLGDRTAEKARTELKNLKLIIIGFIVGGAGLVCSYIFDL